jgi:class 3 adenylate cyclase/8-oxo-dGTP pyrophosphatase MutT (NUDIX family)
LPARVVVPLFEALVPQGLSWGGNYLVEFEPDSPWYEVSVTVAARAVQRGLKTEYHSFHRNMADVREALEELGLSVDREVKRGTLRLIGSYAPTTEVRGNPRDKTGFLTSRPPDLREWSRVVKKQAAGGFEEQDRRWLHIDDNTSLLLQFNNEERIFDGWRTGFIPWGRARELITLNGFVKGVASDAFYRKHESLYDGVFDIVTKEKEGKLEHHARVRKFIGGPVDSGWRTITLKPSGEAVIAVRSTAKEKRRLAAVMVTDIVGYSALMRKDERRAMALLAAQEGVVRSAIPRFDGDVVKGTGDGFLIEFKSALAAAECAVAIQRRMKLLRRGDDIRISVHVGDVVQKNGDIFGDAVNIASRLQAYARPGGICISKQVQEQLSNKMRTWVRYLGTRRLKNITPAMGIYEIILAGQ